MNRRSLLAPNNKKGDIAITILVIGVFAIASFAIISFIFSDNSYGKSFVGISVMQKINADIDEYNFYKNNEVDMAAVDSEFTFIEENNKKYLYQVQLGHDFFGNEEGLLFSVQYPVSKSP